MNAAADITRQLQRRERRARFFAFWQYFVEVMQFLAGVATFFALVVLWCAV